MTGEYSLKFYENLKISQKHSHNERFQAFPFNYIRHKFYISSHVKQDQVSFTPLFFLSFFIICFLQLIIRHLLEGSSY